MWYGQITEAQRPSQKREVQRNGTTADLCTTFGRTRCKTTRHYGSRECLLMTTSPIHHPGVRMMYCHHTPCGESLWLPAFTYQANQCSRDGKVTFQCAVIEIKRIIAYAHSQLKQWLKASQPVLAIGSVCWCKKRDLPLGKKFHVTSVFCFGNWRSFWCAMNSNM